MNVAASRVESERSIDVNRALRRDVREPRSRGLGTTFMALLLSLTLLLAACGAAGGGAGGGNTCQYGSGTYGNCTYGS